jgi:hypothetical protein
LTEQLVDCVPREHRTSDLVTEASAGAVWELFHRYVVHASPQYRQQIAATLSYIALAPVIGPSAALAAIRQEQTVP